MQKNLNNQEMLLENCVTNKKNELCELIESFLKNAVFRNKKKDALQTLVQLKIQMHAVLIL